MRLRIDQTRGAMIAMALIVPLAVGLPVLGQASSSSAETSSAAPASGAVTSAPSDTDIVASGKRVWSDAACYNCHGTNGQGGHSTDFPNGPSLRKSALDAESMLQIIECGIPETRMPAWLKGAYTEVSCFGSDLGPPPTGVLVSGAYSVDDLKALVAYVQVNFMKQPVPTWSDQ